LLQEIDRCLCAATWRNKARRRHDWAQQHLAVQANLPTRHLHGGGQVIYPEWEASHNHKIATLDVTISGMARSLSRRLWRLAAVDMGMQNKNQSATRPDSSPIALFSLYASTAT
jgi:hypothetical protein